ncbi:DNA-deoxyinosine glycosylase [Chitinimonas lacunae]|uniref:DNA-deoxyinosine glycosylase n=1 Tax=Chitinimonas lacunae TaxID=1963018 RepID=A0ABV8MX62_9NEIS
MNPRKQCFPPVVDAQTRLLVLGSLPGEVSLAKSEYYAHRQNQFWRLIGEVIGVAGLRDLDYPSRLDTLRRHGVGLWDVIAEAEREGSLDGNIRNDVHNDLAELVASLPALQAVAFNGGTSARIGRRKLAGLAPPLRLIDLPSSSPAYTLPFADKLAVWMGLREFVSGAAGNRPV